MLWHSEVRWRISATCEKKEKQSYVELINSYVGDNIFYVGLSISYVGDNKSYVGLIKSYVGLSKSYVGRHRTEDTWYIRL